MVLTMIELFVVSVIMAREENYFKNLDYRCQNVLTSIERMRLSQHSSKTLRRAKLTNRKRMQSTRKKLPRSRRHPKKMVKIKKNQLNAECKYCCNKHEQKRDKCHMEKHAIRVEKPAILEQSVPRTRESKKKHSQKFKRKKVNQLDDNTESSYFSEVENICVFGPHCQCCGYVKI